MGKNKEKLKPGDTVQYFYYDEVNLITLLDDTTAFSYTKNKKVYINPHWFKEHPEFWELI